VDEANGRENRRKHGVSIEEAQTVFLDEYAMRCSTQITRSGRSDPRRWLALPHGPVIRLAKEQKNV